MTEPRIFVIHENDEWLPPLRAAFAARRLPLTEWHMADGRFDLTGTPPEGVFYNRQIMFKQRTTRQALLDQHRAINDALQARDPEGARAAVHRHLDFVERALVELGDS